LSTGWWRLLGLASYGPVMAATGITVDRAATAIRRNGTSRPLALLLANELVRDGDTFLDYGCGHGEDVAHLTELGYEARGWDPHHRPDGDRSSADVVLCSYVLNVIEDPAERLDVLVRVHQLAHRVAVVAVRTTAERALMDGATRHRDGWMTAKNTFQTLWSQTDARTLIEAATGTPPVALAPGVFAVFATAAAEEAWREAVGDRIRRTRIHRGPAIHRPGVLEQTYDTHRDAFDALWDWVQSHDRLPEPDEVPDAAATAVAAVGSVGRAGLVLRSVHDPRPVRRAGKREIAYDQHRDAFNTLWDWTLTHGRLPEDDEVPSEASAAVAAAGSVGHAGLVLRDVFGTQPFEQAAADRRGDLTTRFAIARLRRRTKFSDLPTVVQRDVRALFGSYKTACGHADSLLFAVGDPATLRAAAARSPVGKATSDALYVHVAALDLLPAELLVYDACARVVAGTVDGVNLVKFHLEKPRVSYLVYPDFEIDPHPALAESWVVDLRELDLRPHDYRTRANPPVLHRKELFVADDHPRRATFARLTLQEERHGLLDNSLAIGTRDGWQRRLAETGWALRGHRLIRGT
jgi:hypothetical protein